MADPNLMMKMKAHSLLEEKNSKVQEKFKIEFPKVEEELEHAAEASKILIDWIKAIL